MTSIQVCFPTTQSVVFIDGIRSFPADKVPQSMMCRTGTAVSVPASNDYHAFVRSPTGCIERLFEHGRFRLDVSGKTDAGHSWQLAVLMAHAAFATGMLATNEGDPEHVKILICATGEIGPLDLKVGEVAHVSDKIDLARPILEAARARGQRVILAVPPGNRDDITPTARQALEACGVEIMTGDNARSLAEAVELPLPRLAEAASRNYTPGTNPYRGLLAFGAEDRSLFFGRRRAREEGVAQLQAAAAQGRPFLLIHGRSGIGKSSLLRAGLAVDVPERLGQGVIWRVLTVSLRSLGPAGPPARQILGAFGIGLDTADAALEKIEPGERVLLLLDQLEQALIELSPPDAAALGALLQGLVASQRVWVIGSIRSDHLDTLDRVPNLARLARDGRLYRLEPPTLFELGEMIRQPAAMAGLVFQPGPHGEALPERLAQVAVDAPGSVPLLQVMLTQLAGMADHQGRIPFDAYDRLGGIDKAVMRLAEEAVAALPVPAASTDALDHALSALIQVDQISDRVLSRTLDPHQVEPEVSRILAVLVDHRILVAETGTQPSYDVILPDHATIRLAHETLITGWPRLATLADRLREDLILRDWLETAARDWNQSNQDPGLLIASQARLIAARQAVDAKRISFPYKATKYLTAAEQKLQATQRGQRRRRFAIGAAVMILPILTAGLYQREQARTADFEVAQARSESNAAETRARMAELELQASQEQAARAEAETRATQVREAAAQRLADLSRIRAAEVLMQEGERDRALSELLDASEKLVDDPELDPSTRDNVLISFERVLEDAFRLRLFRVGRNTEVAFGQDSEIYLSGQHTGIYKIDARGEDQHVGSTNGEFYYAILVIPPKDEAIDDGQVLWKSQNGLTIGRGFDGPNHEDTVVIDFIPNLGSVSDYRNWQTAWLEDGRVLIAQSYDPDRLANVDQLDWAEGSDRGAYIFDPVSESVIPVNLLENETFEGLIGRLEGRQPYSSEPALNEIQNCAGDAPGSNRYRLAQSIIADVDKRSEVGYSRIFCRWQNGTAIVATVNFASSVYRRVFFYQVDDLEGYGNEPNLIHDTDLDTGEFSRFDLWANIAVFSDDDGERTIVTYAKREVRVWHDYETHSFPTAENIHRVVALGPGLAAALTEPGNESLGGSRSLIWIDVSRSFSEFLAEALPPMPVEIGPSRAPRYRMEEPECLLEGDLTTLGDGSFEWTDQVTGIVHFIPQSLINRNFVCIYPLPTTIFDETTYDVIHNGELLTYVSGQLKDYLFEGPPSIEHAMAGNAPLPLSPEQTTFMRSSHSLIRVDRHAQGGARAYELLRTRDNILGVAISPSGTRAVVATSDNMVSVEFALWSLSAGRRWRELGSVHRWKEVSFPQDDLALAGHYGSPQLHRLFTIKEARSIVRHLLGEPDPELQLELP